jgi:replicative DNA helicase
MLVEPGCIGQVLPLLPDSRAFYFPENQLLYDGIVKLYRTGKGIDAVMLRDEIDRTGDAGKIADCTGGDTAVEYIAKVLDSVPSAANAIYYANIVREKERERVLAEAVREITAISDGPDDVNEKIQKVQEVVLDLEPYSQNDEFVPIGKIATLEATNIQEHQQGVIKTGFTDLDRTIQGFGPGELIIIGARPAMGKSALGVNIATNMAKAGVSVLFFSLEMTIQSLVARVLCSEAAVNLADALADRIPTEDWDEVYRQALDLTNKSVPLIFSEAGKTPEQQMGLIRRLKETHGVRCVFVDYLQLMSSARRTEGLRHEITLISRSLKTIAVRERIAVVALSQLNRAVESREGNRPRMSDLRESGAIEQDADMIIFVHRPGYYGQKNSEAKTNPQLIVAKNRRGPIGTVDVAFCPDYVKFGNLAPPDLGDPNV